LKIQKIGRDVSDDNDQATLYRTFADAGEVQIVDSAQQYSDTDDLVSVIAHYRAEIKSLTSISPKADWALTRLLVDLAIILLEDGQWEPARDI
jgi:hypothetical protein